MLTKIALVHVVGGHALHGIQALLHGFMRLLLQCLLHEKDNHVSIEQCCETQHA